MKWRSGRWLVLLALALALLGLAVPVLGGITRFWLLPGDYDLIKLDLSTPQAKFVALTFDDGPDSVHTPRILDILKQKGVRATFFVLGERATNNQELIRRIVQDGHVIGSHSTQHVALNKLSYDERRKELEETNHLLAGMGIKVQWFRPPFGAYDRRLIDLAHALGMRTVLWTVDPQDWQQEVEPEEIVRRVMGRVENGSVILLHAINPRTVTALPQIIDNLRERGFRLVTMDEWALLMSGKLKLEGLEGSRRLPPAQRPLLPAPSGPKLPPSSSKPAPRPKEKPQPAPPPTPVRVEQPGEVSYSLPPAPPPTKPISPPSGEALPPYLTLEKLSLAGTGEGYRVYHSPAQVWRMFWPGYREVPGAETGGGGKRSVVVEVEGPPTGRSTAAPAQPPRQRAKQPTNFPRPKLLLLTRAEILLASLEALRPVEVEPVDTTAPGYQDRIAIGKPVLLPAQVNLGRLIELISQGEEEIFLDGLAGVPKLSSMQKMALYLVSTRYYDPAREMIRRLRLPPACSPSRFSAPREVVLVIGCDRPAQWKVPPAATHLRRLSLVPVGLSWKQNLRDGEVVEIGPGRPLVVGFAW